MIIKIKLILRQTIKFIYEFSYNIVDNDGDIHLHWGLFYGFDEDDIRECSKIEHIYVYIKILV